MIDYITPEAVRLLEHVHVNLPWEMFDRFRDLVVERRIHVEIGFSAVDLDGVSRRRLEEASALLANAGCRTTLHAPFWELCPGSSDPLIRQVTLLRLHQFLDVAAVLQPAQVVCHTGYDPRHHEGMKARWIESSLPIWEALADRAGRIGVRILLENVWEPEPSLHRELFSRLPSEYLGFCLDVGHQHCFSEAPLDAWLEALSSRLGELHLHDNDGRRDAHLPVGRGTVDFGTLFKFLSERRITPLLTLEPHREDHLWESLEGLSRVIGEGFGGAERAGTGGFRR
jgi:sugar phosphate isomerase/epimerase